MNEERTIMDRVAKAIELAGSFAATQNRDVYNTMKVELEELHRALYTASKDELLESKDLMEAQMNEAKEAGNMLVATLLDAEIDYADVVLAEIYGL